MGRCPFHGDRSPSFSVNKDFYHCFGCKESGDAISFLMKLHGLSFEEAIEDLAEKANLKIPESSYSSSEDEQALYQRRVRLQKTSRVLHFASLKYFHQNLIHPHGNPQWNEAVEYLKKRGITAETINQFQIGVSGSKVDGLVQFLSDAKAPLDLARETGLIKPSQKQAGDYDFFRERVLFPLIDIRGRVTGFGGRLLPSADQRESDIKLPKYLNSSESELFQKSKFLYGLFQAKRAIREKETAIVVEGYFDVVGMHQYGFENVVATCGTSLSEDHLKTLSRLAKKIIIFFDQDEAGINATEKAMELGLRNGVLFYGIPYESKLDPDEFLIPDLNDPEKKNTKKMQTWIENAFPLLDHQMDRILRESDGDLEKRSLAVKKILFWLESYSDEVGRAIRVDQLIQKWKIPVNALGKLGAVSGMRPRSMPMAAQGQRASGPQRPTGRSARRPAILPYDRQLLYFFFKPETFGRFFEEAQKQIPEKDTVSAFFDDTELRAWVERLNQVPQGIFQFKQSPMSFLESPISQELQSVIMEIMLQEDESANEVLLEALLKRGIQKTWVRFSHDLKQQMAQADASQDMEKFKELSQQFLDLQRKLKEFEGSYVSGN